MSEVVDPELIRLLACPRDGAPLTAGDTALVCEHGHRYPVVQGIPVFLVPDERQTIGLAAESLTYAETGTGAPLFVKSVGVSDAERAGVERDWRSEAPVDAVIAYLIGATSGLAYRRLIGRLPQYPIPNIPIPEGNGGHLLDIGCSWSRWSVSAARKGWSTVGLDPSLGALAAAKRAFGGANRGMKFVCGDARHLPFRDASFAGAFSYSVIQHFAETDAEMAVAEIGRVLAPGGFAKVQMAHRGGLRSRQVMRRKTYESEGPFRVRYWSLPALQEVFSRHVGPARVIAEAFGGLGLLPEDRHAVDGRAKALIFASTLLKRLSRYVPPLIRVADSVYVEAVKA